MGMSAPLPMIGIPLCVRFYDEHRFHMAGEKYIRAVAEGMAALPVLIPALGETLSPAVWIARLDGLLLTGSPSNILPEHYGGPASAAGTLHDPDRDATTLPLIRAALAAGVPMLGICRGLQELNVALGGSLHQQVQALPGKADHRAAEALPVPEAYGPAHPVRLVPGGYLAGLLACETLSVNSLHAQGIDRLAAPLVPEAHAPDGLIEAVRAPAAAALTLAVQWHPEWRFQDNPAAATLLRAFGDAARQRAAARMPL